MYGFVNYALELLVLKHFGLGVWEQIKLLCNSDNFDEAFDLEYRGLVTMKGKAEPMKCWFLNRSKSDYVNVPHPEDLLR